MNFCLAAIDNLEMSRGLGTLCKSDDREWSRSDATPTRRALPSCLSCHGQWESEH